MLSGFNGFKSSLIQRWDHNSQGRVGFFFLQAAGATENHRFPMFFPTVLCDMII